MAPKKQKYSINDIYEDYRNSLYVFRSRILNGHSVRVRVPISLKTFKLVIFTYFELKLEELMRFGTTHDIEVNLISGKFTFRKYLQTRSFHTIKDNEESFKQGKLVKKRIPIMEDFFIKALWMHRKPSFGKLRVKFAEKVRRNKIKLEKEIGLDAFRMKEIPVKTTK